MGRQDVASASAVDHFRLGMDDNEIYFLSLLHLLPTRIRFAGSDCGETAGASGAMFLVIKIPRCQTVSRLAVLFQKPNPKTQSDDFWRVSVTNLKFSPFLIYWQCILYLTVGCGDRFLSE